MAVAGGPVRQVHGAQGLRSLSRQACNACRAKKLRCSGEKTGCSRCKTLRSPCQYASARRRGREKAEDRHDAGHTADHDRDDCDEGHCNQQIDEHDNNHENDGNDTATDAPYSWIEQGLSPERLAMSELEGWSTIMGAGQEEFAVPLPQHQALLDLDHLPLALSDINPDAVYTPSSASSSNDSVADVRSCFSAPRGGCLQYPDQLPVASDMRSPLASTDSPWHDDGLFQLNFSGLGSPMYSHSFAEYSRTLGRCSCLERLVLLLDKFEPTSPSQGDQGTRAGPSIPTPATVEATFTTLREALGYVQSTTGCTACATSVDATTVLALLVLRLIKALRLVLPPTLSTAVAAASPLPGMPQETALFASIHDGISRPEWRKVMCTAALDLARRLESLAQAMTKRALVAHHRFLVHRLMTAQVQLAANVQTLLLASMDLMQ